MNSWDRTGDGFRRYLLSSGRSQGTAKTYSSNLLTFWRWCARYEVTPWDADRRLIREWIADRQETVSAARRHNDLAALRCFYAWLIEQDYREDDPTINVKVKRGQTLPTEPITHDQYEALLAHCRDERETLIIMMFAATGMRLSEMAHLRAEDIDWNRGEIKVRGKGDKERRIAPDKEVLGRLHAYCGMFATGSPFLRKNFGTPLTDSGIRKVVEAVGKRAGIDDLHPHRFRAYFATSYVEQLADIQALQGVLGHASLQTTALYSQWTREKRGLQQMRALKLGAKAG